MFLRLPWVPIIPRKAEPFPRALQGVRRGQVGQTHLLEKVADLLIGEPLEPGLPEEQEHKPHRGPPLQRGSLAARGRELLQEAVLARFRGTVNSRPNGGPSAETAIELEHAEEGLIIPGLGCGQKVAHGLLPHHESHHLIERRLDLDP